MKQNMGCKSSYKLQEIEDKISIYLVIEKIYVDCYLQLLCILLV